MLLQRGAAVILGLRGDTEGRENGDEGLIRHDDLSAVGVLVLGGNAVAAGQLDER
jgi:hypothetical protein